MLLLLVGAPAVADFAPSELELTKPPPLRQVSERALDALRPARRSDPMEWVPRNVFFPAVSSATARSYDFYTFPYHRGVWEVFLDPLIYYISLRWATQLGKTALITAQVAYNGAENPCPMIWGCPDAGLLSRIFKRKLYPVLRASAATSRLLPPRHLQKETEIDLRDCVVYSAVSGSVSALGDISAQVIFLNEIDKWTRKVSIEGDSASLIEERKKAFPRWKVIRESTPSEAGVSRIDEAIEQSDDRTYRIPCPSCLKYQQLLFERLVMPHGDDGRLADAERCRRESYYPCLYCESRIEDHDKLPAMRRGVWARRGEGVRDDGTVFVENAAEVVYGGHAGFSLSSLYSPTITFGEFAATWAAAQGNIGKIRAFVNGWIGRSFAPRSKVTSEDEVLMHRGLGSGHAYSRDTCPEPPRAVFLIVDVQEDCLWYSSWAVGTGKKFFLLRYGQLNRDLRSVAPLRRYMFTTQDGRRFTHTHCLMDSGYGQRVADVYDFCRKQRFIPTKGSSSDALTQPIKWSAVQDLNLLIINTIAFKDQLADRIKQTNLDGAGAWRLPAETGFDFARQFTAEKRIVETDKWGREKPRWVNPAGRDNHYWDIAVIADAAATALELEGLDFFAPLPASEKPPANANMEGMSQE